MPVPSLASNQGKVSQSVRGTIKNRQLRVAVIYHLWPHYRQPIMSVMDGSEHIGYDFFGSGEVYQGIRHADPSAVKRFVKAPFRYYGRLMWQPAAVKAVISNKYDAVILLADPNFASTWVASIIARIRGIPIIFWGHGWVKKEGFVKKVIRKTYFSLSNHFLIYAERGKKIGIESGFPEAKITVVYNSLDVDKADTIVKLIESGKLNTIRPQAFFPESSRPVLICTARLTEKCRFDLLLNAASILEGRGVPVNVLLVGDGPKRGELEAHASRLGVATHFFGACYDEETTGQLLYHSDLTVSPGKIGLTAMHSLMYGTPAVTHDNLDEQMPEVEAIEEGRTGSFFRNGDSISLADTIEKWLRSPPPRLTIRNDARTEIRAKWTPHVQAKIIEKAVVQVVDRG